MGESATTAVKDIEATRRRLETDVAELVERLPAPAVWAKRLVGLAVGGGVGGSLFWFVVHRIRNNKTKAKAKKAMKHKEKATARVESPVIQVLPPEWADSLGELFKNDSWKGPAIAVGSLWLVLRLAELRRLRRLTNAMLAR